jgi:hypothetical protein
LIQFSFHLFYSKIVQVETWRAIAEVCVCVCVCVCSCVCVCVGCKPVQVETRRAIAEVLHKD